MGSGKYIARPDTKQCFLRSLAEFKNLRILALEYGHIADGSGNALLSLLPVIRRPHFRLELICRGGHIPGRTDAALGVGGYEIPDTAWRRVTIACPDIYLFMAFFRIRDYDNIQRFLTPSTPLREVHLQLGIDLSTTLWQDSDTSCFMRLLAYRYAGILELKEFKILIQDDETKETHWREIIENYTEEFKDIMHLYNIKFSLNIYKM